MTDDNAIRFPHEEQGEQAAQALEELAREHLLPGGRCVVHDIEGRIITQTFGPWANAGVIDGKPAHFIEGQGWIIDDPSPGAELLIVDDPVKPAKGDWKKNRVQRSAPVPQALKDSEGMISLPAAESQQIGRQLAIEAFPRMELSDPVAQARRNSYYAVHGARSFVAAPYDIMRDFVKKNAKPFQTLLPDNKKQAKKPDIYIETQAD